MYDNYTKMKEFLNDMLNEFNAYEQKPTKASAKRLRMLATNIKKIATDFKKEMMPKEQ